VLAFNDRSREPGLVCLVLAYQTWSSLKFQLLIRFDKYDEEVSYALSTAFESG
jgi:hypothetical protein